MIPTQLTDSIVPVCAGLFVSLVNKYILSNPRLDTCWCTTIQPEEADSESDSIESVNSTDSKLSDALSKSSATTTATLPLAHPIHAHHIYYVHH